jgi:adenylate kinase family enzyme
MRRIVLIGCPASGKTTLGNHISKKYNIPTLHLDRIFWVEPKGITQDVFLEQQNRFMDNNLSWISDGNFHRSTSFGPRVQNATSVIIFDLPKTIVYWRFLKRLISKRRSEMPEHRKETFQTIWGLVKYIWKFNTDDIMRKIEELDVKSKILVIDSLKFEKEFYNSI